MANWIKKILAKNKREKEKKVMVSLDAKKIAKLYYLATVDTKTQLYNYRHFHSVLKHEMAIAKRYKRNLSMLLLDLDDFKRINDTYGYLRGDEVLQMVATIIKSSIRETDIAGRFGGEEFVVLMPETSIEKAKEVAERIRKDIAEDKFLARFGVTISIGVSSNSNSKKDINKDTKTISAYSQFMPKNTNEKHNINNSDLFERANIAVRFAKEHNKNRVIAYEELPKTSFLEKIKKASISDYT